MSAPPSQPAPAAGQADPNAPGQYAPPAGAPPPGQYPPPPGGAPPGHYPPPPQGYYPGYPAYPGYPPPPGQYPGYAPPPGQQLPAGQAPQPAQPGYYPPPPGQYPGYYPGYGQPPAPYGAYPPPPGAPPAAGDASKGPAQAPPAGAPPAPGAPPAAGQPPYPYPPPGGSPYPAYGAPPPVMPGYPIAPGGYGAPPAMPYGAPPAAGFQLYYLGVQIVDPNATPAVLGATKVPGYDPVPDFEKFHKLRTQVMNGIDESSVVPAILALTVQQRDALNDHFTAKLGKGLSDWLEPNLLSSEVKTIVRALMLGPLMYDVELLKKSLSGIGTDEMLLTELLLNRTSEDLRLLSQAYKQRYGKDLTDAVKSDLSGKLERMFVMALSNQRTPDNLPVDPSQVNTDVDRLIKAGKDKEEMPFIEIFVNRSRPHLAAVITGFGKKYKSLSKVVKKAFSGNLENALLYVLHGVKSKRDGQGIWRDAKLLEKTMAGLGTRDSTLIYRVVRAHWDSARFKLVQEAYSNRFSKSLESRIKGETSGAYRTALIYLVKKAEQKK